MMLIMAVVALIASLRFRKRAPAAAVNSTSEKGAGA
jgi:hypothetical protein